MITGPEPVGCLPSSLRLWPGGSVENVTSTTMATPGSSANALVRAPAKLISSWADGDRGHIAGRAALLGDQPRRLQRDEGAEPVVHRARDHPAVEQLDRLAGDDRDVAEPHLGARVVGVLGPDVDVQVLELRDLLAVVLLEQMDGLLAHDAGHPALARDELHALAHEDLRVPAADVREPQEAVVVDVHDRQADLVDVADDGEQRPVAGALDAGHRRAHHVAADLREPVRGLAPDLRRRALVAGRAGSRRAGRAGRRAAASTADPN